MRLSRATTAAFGSSCLVALLAAACGSTRSSNVDGGNASAGTAGSSGTSGNGGPNLGLAGADGSGDVTGSGGDSTGPQCAGQLIQAERIPLDMYVMLDVSGSMLEATVGDPAVTKWQAVSSALSDFVSDKASDGIGMGLQVFPVANPDAPVACTTDDDCGQFGPCLNRACWPLANGAVQGCLDDNGCAADQTCVVLGECSADSNYVCDRDATATCNANRGNCVVPPATCLGATDCRPATYATPAADIASLPGAKPAILKVIQAAMPDPGGLTPTGPALGGAIQQAKAWAKAHPDHQVVAVLATDGLPTLKAKGQVCAEVTQIADIDAVVNLAGSGRAAAPLISTFVIGVLAPDDVNAGAPQILDAIASSGGTDQAFIVNTQGNVQQEFRTALDQIRQAGLSCDLLVPQADAGKTVDYLKVNVTFDDGGGAKDLGYVIEVKNCDAKNGGWYYDVPDPMKAVPQRILTCPKTCSDFQKTDMGSVQIKLGCETHSGVK